MRGGRPYQISNFRIYVSDRDYFMAKLPPFKVINSSSRLTWNDNENYYRTMFVTYCASYWCGLSMEHLTPHPKVYQLITLIIRFHLYIKVLRLMKRMEAGGSMRAICMEFGAGELYAKTDLVSRKSYCHGQTLSDGTIGEVLVYTLNDTKNDFKRYVAATSHGFKPIRMQYLNQSIEAYAFSVLGRHKLRRIYQYHRARRRISGNTARFHTYTNTNTNTNTNVV